MKVVKSKSSQKLYFTSKWRGEGDRTTFQNQNSTFSTLQHVYDILSDAPQPFQLQ